MKTSLLTSTLVFTVLVAASSSAAVAQTSVNLVPSPPAIVVSGNAQVEATPDQAVVRIGIVHQSTSAKEAQDNASKIGQAIQKAIVALGVTANRIQTSRLTISPVYLQQRPGSNEAPRITGYTAANSVSVTLENLAQIGPVVDAGLDNGANQLDGVQFKLKNDGPVREQALKLAVEEAKGKAAAIAAALGVALGPVLEVSESGVSVSPLEDRGNGGVALLSARAAVATPVSPGQLIVNAGVVLRYSISK
jgi:uncharacterized protein YggE